MACSEFNSLLLEVQNEGQQEPSDAGEIGDPLASKTSPKLNLFNKTKQMPPN